MNYRVSTSGPVSWGRQRTAQGYIRLKVQLAALEQTAQKLWALPDILSVNVQSNLEELALVTRSVAFEHWVDIVESVLDQAGHGLEKVKTLSWNYAQIEVSTRKPLAAY
jgi:hypothetical protein